MTNLGSMVRASAMFGLIAASAVQAQTPTPTPTTASSMCVGDCKNADSVDISDLVVGVNIALGVQQLAACPAFDCMHDGTVTVTCLVQGVNNALLGCGFVTPTPGGVPTATPTTASVVRVFTIDPGKGDLSSPADSASGLFSSGVTGSNAAQHISPGPLTLVMGAQDASGVAPLQLMNDVTISIDVDLNGSCLCLKLLTAGQQGFISCNGGVPYDTQAERTVGMPGNGWTATSGLGSPGGAGDAELLVMANFEDVTMKNCAQADCANFQFTEPPNLFAFTTTTATGVQDTTGKPITQSLKGEPFDCAHFGMSGSGGRLVAPAPANIVIQTANVFRFAEMAPQ